MQTYPLKLHFQFIALAPRIKLTDAKGVEIFYIEQKVFALKEAIKVFNNSLDKKLLYTIKANQIIDFGAKYTFRSAKDEQEIGSIQQQGLRSLFQASYTLFNEKDKPVYKIIQTNPWIAMLDSLLSLIPFIELINGLFLHPIYALSEQENSPALIKMKKKLSLLESEFEISLLTKDISGSQELLFLLAFIMIVQLERNRG